MIKADVNVVGAFTIDEAWREVMWLCARNGYDFVIKHGSYKGQIRRQLSEVMIKIAQPWKRPLAPITPPGYPPPTSEAEIEQYFLNYIMSSEVHGNEDYTYGKFISPQLPKIIEMLIKSEGNTNQASINIGGVDNVNLDDPPCLRVIDFKVVEKTLQMSVLFRSWDLYAGMPSNLGGLQLLKEYVLSQIEDHIEVTDGAIVAYSDGLHLYDHWFELANAFNVENDIIVDKHLLNAKKEFNKLLDNK